MCLDADLDVRESLGSGLEVVERTWIRVKKEFSTSGAKFVYSKNELGYQEVLDSFPEASQITIITYNISEKKEALVHALKSAGEHCTINVITNIPSRWETYYGNSFRDRAKQKINLYLSKLIGITGVMRYNFIYLIG